MPQSAARRRFEARRSILTGTLSPLAKLIYETLDDLAANAGLCCRSQADLGTALGYTARHMRRGIAELRAAGEVTVTRHRRTGATYTLRWVTLLSGQKMSALNGQERTRMSALNSPLKSVGTKHITNDVEANELAWVRQALLDFPAAKHLTGEPDIEICRRCVQQADPHAIAGILRQLHITRRKPAYSWAWFPVVISAMATQRKGPHAATETGQGASAVAGG